MAELKDGAAFVLTEERKGKQGRGKWRPRRIRNPWNLFLLVAYGCIGLGMVGLVMIFGPVAQAESTYRAKQVLSLTERFEGRGIGALVPQFSFDLVRGEIAEGYGIVIPKLYIQEQVVANVDPTDRAVYLPALKQGIAHAAGSAYPGDEGLGYYFAHSSGLDAPIHGGRAVFYLLGKLEMGDEVRLYRDSKRYTYRVVDSRVVEATEVGFLSAEYERETIVLQTCWPVGTSSKRLLVTAERV